MTDYSDSEEEEIEDKISVDKKSETKKSVKNSENNKSIKKSEPKKSVKDSEISSIPKIKKIEKEREDTQQKTSKQKQKNSEELNEEPSEDLFLHCFKRNCPLVPQIIFSSPKTIQIRCPCSEEQPEIPTEVYNNLLSSFKEPLNEINKKRNLCLKNHGTKEQEPLIIYCKTCYESICSKCIPAHPKHNFEKLSDTKKNVNIQSIENSFGKAVNRYKTYLSSLKKKIINELENEIAKVQKYFEINRIFNQNIVMLFQKAFGQNECTPNDYHTMEFLRRYNMNKFQKFPNEEEFKVSRENLDSLYNYLKQATFINLELDFHENKLPKSSHSKQSQHTYKTSDTKKQKDSDNTSSHLSRSSQQQTQIQKQQSSQKQQQQKQQSPQKKQQQQQQSPQKQQQQPKPKLTELKLLRKEDAHEHGITCICALSSGSFATSSRDCSIKIFTFNPMPITKLSIYIKKAHSKGVSYLCSAPNNLLISSGYDKAINIWEIKYQTYKLLKTITGHYKSVIQVILLSDYRFASCSEDTTIKIFSLDSPFNQIAGLISHKDITSIIQRKNHEVLISGSGVDSQQLNFWDIQNYKQEKKQIDNVYCACQTSLCEFGENRLLVGGSEIVKVIHLDKAQILGEIKDHFFKGLNIYAISDVGSAIVLGSEDGSIGLIDKFNKYSDKPIVLKKRQAHYDVISGVMPFNSKVFITASFDNSIKIWEI